MERIHRRATLVGGGTDPHLGGSWSVMESRSTVALHVHNPRKPNSFCRGRVTVTLCFSPACRWFTFWGHDATEKRRLSSSLQSRRSTAFLIASYVIFLDAATLPGSRYKMRRDRDALSAEDSHRAVAAPPLCVSAAHDCRGNNSRPELQEPGESAGRGRARAGCGVTLISHSALTRKERNTIINALVVGGGEGRKRNTLINTEDIMILGEICPSRSSQRFKSLFFFFLAKTSTTGPPPLLFMIPVYYGLDSQH